MELKIENLTKAYGKKVALRDFSATLSSGIYGLLGPNGAGKSTMMKIITENLSADKGRILVDGTPSDKLGADYRAMLGYMPQQQGMYPHFTARELSERQPCFLLVYRHCCYFHYNPNKYIVNEMPRFSLLHTKSCVLLNIFSVFIQMQPLYTS